LHTGAHRGGFIAGLVGGHAQQGLGVLDHKVNVFHDFGALGFVAGGHVGATWLAENPTLADWTMSGLMHINGRLGAAGARIRQFALICASLHILGAWVMEKADIGVPMERDALPCCSPANSIYRRQ
jgi:hypothetical protein